MPMGSQGSRQSVDGSKENDLRLKLSIRGDRIECELIAFSFDFMINKKLKIPDGVLGFWGFGV